MSVRIRLTRIGGRKDPVWRVVVADQRSPRDGRVIETVGHYNAQTNPSTVDVDLDRVRAWVARGAQPTNQVRNLLRVAEKQAAAAPQAPAEKAAGGAQAPLEYFAPPIVAGPPAGGGGGVVGGERPPRALLPGGGG